MRSFTNNLAACAALGAVIAGAIPALAAGYPDHAVKVIVPFAAGGPTDVMARLIAQKLSESLKQQFYVEDHAGAGGNIGIAQAARSAPDGYTILVASSSFMVNPSLYAKPPFDALKGFHACDPGRRYAEYSGGASFDRGQEHEGLDRVDEVEPRQIHHRQSGRRHDAAACWRTAQADLRDRCHERAVRRLGPGDPVSARSATPIAFSTFPPTVPHVSSGLLRGLAVTAA